MDTEVWEHTKKDAPPNHPTSLWVSYIIDRTKKVDTWVCFNHDSHSLLRKKAAEWWERRSVFPVPDSVQEAIDLINRGAVAETKKIRAKKIGKYYTLVDEIEFTPIPTELREPEISEPQEHCVGCNWYTDNYCAYKKTAVSKNDGGCEFFDNQF
jgi:hypothetical protein